MDVSFGARLRSQRERQQVSLAVIAERTKIKASLLEGLERDDVSGWPGGIFRRSFIRSYAEAIGLQPDDVVREFLERYPEPVEEDVTAALAAAHDGRRPPTRFGYLLASAFSALPAVAKSRSKRREGGTLPEIENNPPATDARTVPSPSDGPRPADAPQRAATVDYASNAAQPTDPADTALTTEAVPAAEQPFLPVIGESAAAILAQAAAAAHAFGEGNLTATRSELDEMSSRLQSARAEAARLEADVTAVAGLCTRLARALHPRDLAGVLEDTSQLLRAVGIIVWVWDPQTRTLGHVLAHGYSRNVLARLPRVDTAADNAIADAFRTGETRIVSGSAEATGAVVAPIVSAAGCMGALAVELQDRDEERPAVSALASILAAQFAAIVSVPAVVEAAATA
jgi:cytoskeletal protein RodZ